jgi:hypothetical protein
MATFTDPEALRRHIEKAAAEQIKEALITSQAWLGSSKNSPRDTGRLRSSWFAAEGQPSGEVAPEDADAPQTDAKGLEVQIDQDYHLTNNLPYAQPIALGVNLPPSWGGEHRVVSAPKTWFIDFVNAELPRIGDAAGRVIKRRFDL